VKSSVKTTKNAIKSVFALMGSPPSQRFYVFRRLWQKMVYKTVEKPASEKLMENVHMQGFRNPEE
jgi:hypothetical protein